MICTIRSAGPLLLVFFTLVFGLAGTPAARGAGIAGPGFAVSDFASEFPTNNRFGPMGVAFDSHGALFAVDNTDGDLYKFSPSGGPASHALVGADPIPGYLVGLAFDKAENLYVAREQVEDGGDIAQIDPSSGAVVRVVASGFTPLGITTDPVSGDLFVTVVGGPVKRISSQTSQDPVVTDYGESLSAPDGIVFGPDGTLYTEDEGSIISMTGTAAPNPGTATTVGYVAGADGLAVAETTNPDERPFLAVNSNDGSITKVDLATTPATYTPMVTDGTRGDLTAVGPDSCLYATQFESIEKVTASDGTCPFYPSSPFHCSDKIGAVSPAAGQVPIGNQVATTVSIDGKSFCPETKIQFGAHEGKGNVVEAQLKGSTELTATVPREAASGPISLITRDGQHGPAVAFPLNSYRNTDAFSFRNFASNNDVTWSDIATVFGSNAYQSWSLCNFCAPLIITHSSGADAVYKIINNALKGGLCFGFSLGSLRLSEGLDPLAPTADTGSRGDSLWRASAVYNLPTYEIGGNFGFQLRHYLYQEATAQFSIQHYDAVGNYFAGLRHSSNGAARAHYLYNQIKGSFAQGLGIVEIFMPGEGHAVVPYGLDPHPDGSFDIDVYDSNQPFSPAEVTEPSLHEATLSHSQIHVNPQGNWSYLMKLESQGGGLVDVPWSGPPSQIHVVSLDVMKGTLSPSGKADPAYSTVTVGASVSQVVDARGRDLYDAGGNLVPEARRPDVVVIPPMTQLASGPSTWSAPYTSLLLGTGGPYTETVASGELNFLGNDTDGQITTAGSRVRLWRGGERVLVAPKQPGPAKLQLTHHSHAGQATVAISGRLTGATALDLGTDATISVVKSTTLSISVTRAGPAQPPQTFSSNVHLSSGQQLRLGSPRHLDLTSSGLRVTVSKQGHAHTMILVNRAPHPSVRIVRIATKRVGGKIRVTVGLAVSRARKGTVIVTVRGAGHAATTRVGARSRVAVSLLLPVRLHVRRLRVLAVALSRTGQAGRIATRASRAR